VTKYELEQLKELLARQWEKYQEQDKIAVSLRGEWCDTLRKIEAIEKEIEIERLVAERLAGRVAG